MQMEAFAILTQVLNSGTIELTRTPNQSVHDIIFRQQEFSEVRTILSGNPGNHYGLHNKMESEFVPTVSPLSSGFPQLPLIVAVLNREALLGGEALDSEPYAIPRPVIAEQYAAFADEIPV